RDALTVDRFRFAAQLLAIRKRYPLITSEDLVEKLARRDFIPPTSVAVHFDDRYQEVQQQGMPILVALGIPATAFVNSGFVNSDRVFEHDLETSPFRFANS